MNEEKSSRVYDGHPANFLEATGPCKTHVRFSSNGAIRTIKRAEWNRLPAWNVVTLAQSTGHEKPA